MAELPPEIVLLVLREAYYLGKADTDGEDLPDRPTLCSCSLVNSTWRDLAQSLLFKSVVCDPSFEKAVLRTDSALLKHVRIIDFTIPHDAKGFGEMVGCALDRCHSIYEIVWHGSGRGTLSDSTLSDIRKRESSVQSLRIHWYDPSTAFLYLLPSCFPAVQFLSLRIFPSHRQRMPPPPDTFLMGCSLFELRLFGVPHDFFSGFFRSQNALEVLEIPCIASSQFLEALLPSLWNLRSLRLRRFTQIERHLVETCTRLEELMVAIQRQSAPLPNTLPPSLKHILIEVPWVYDLDVGAFVSSLTHAVMRTGSTLRSICLNGQSWKIGKEALASLRSACNEHGINLAEHKGATWPDEMCVKTLGFPRRRSVSNFDLMN